MAVSEASSLIKSDSIPFKRGRKIRTKHSIPKSFAKKDYESVIEADSAKFIHRQRYSLEIKYSKGVPFKWLVIGSSGSASYDVDPRKLPVFVNPTTPKFFHSSIECKKIGAFRKLNEFTLDELLLKNRTSLGCPQCSEKDKGFIYAIQFLLDEDKE